MSDDITLLLAIEARDRATAILDSINKKVGTFGSSIKSASTQATRSAADIEAANTRAAAATASYDRALAAQKTAQGDLTAAMARSQAALQAQTIAERDSAIAAEHTAAVVRDAAASEEAALVKLQETEKLVATRSREMADAQELAAGKTRNTGAILTGVAVAGAATALAVGAIGAVSVKAAADYQASTNRLITSAGETHANIEMVRTGMLKLAGDVGYSAEQLSTAMYTIESGGQHGAAGLTVLRAAAEGAKTENADLKEVADAVTSVLVDYHLKAEDAAAVTSKLVAATSAGKTTFQELAAAMPAILPVASAAHVSLNDILGDLAAMTVHGMSAQQSAQNLADTIRHMQNPTAVQAKELALLGLTTTQLADDLKTKGLSGTLQEISARIMRLSPPGTDKVIGDLRAALAGLSPPVRELGLHLFDGSMSMKEYTKAAQALDPISAKQAMSFATLAGSMHRIGDQQTSGAQVMQNYGQALAKATGDATGLNVALMLSGENAEIVNGAVRTVSDATTEAGNHVKGWSDIQSTFNYKLDALRGKLEAAKIEIGTGLLPTVTRMVTETGKMVGPISDWIGKHEKLTATILETLAVLGALAAAIKLVQGVMAMFAVVNGGLTGVMKGLNAVVAFTRVMLVGAGEDVGRFRGALDAAKTAAAETKSGIGSLGSFLSGPLGIALTAATLLVAGFANAHAQAKAEEQRHKQAIQELTDAIKENGGAIDANIRQLAAKHASDDHALQLAKKVGISLQDVTDAYIKGGAAIESIKQRLDVYIQAQQVAMAHDQEHSTVYTRNIKNARDLIGVLDAQEKAMKDSADAADLQASALHRDSPAVETLSKALQVLNSDTASVVDKTNALKAAEDAVYGAAQAADQAHQAYAASVDALTKSIEENGASLKITSEAGRANRDAIIAQLKASNDQYFADISAAQSSADVAAATKKATEAHDANTQALIDQATKAGMDRGEVQKLIDTYGHVPTDVTTQISVTGVSEVMTQLQQMEIAQLALKQGIDVGQATSEYRHQRGMGSGGLWRGGPVAGPGTSTSDSIPVWLSRGEYVIPAHIVQALGIAFFDNLIGRRAARGPGTKFPGDGSSGIAMARGGAVSWPFPMTVGGSWIPTMAQALDAAMGPVAKATRQWLWAQAGKPYVWDSAGPGGFDCSGLISAVYNQMRGWPPYAHTFSTMNEGDYFAPGRGLFTAGWTNPGEPGPGGDSVGHTAGVLAGLPFESRGGDGVVVGSGVTPVSSFAHLGHFDRGGPLRPGWTLAHNGTGQTEWVSPPGQGSAQVYIDLRESKFFTTRDVDDLIDLIEKRLVRVMLPGAGVQVRR